MLIREIKSKFERAILPMEDLYCYWLMPEEKSRKALQLLIDKLAVKFNTVTFEPHITLSVVGKRTDKCFKEVLSRIASQTEPLLLQPQELVFGDSFTQSAYLIFKESKPLNNLNRQLISLLETVPSTPFYPHLSLLYGTLTPKDQEALRNEITLNLEPFKFEGIKVIKSSSSVLSSADVNGWVTLFSQQL